MEDDRARAHLSSNHREALKPVLARALNKNQILILSEIDGTSSSASSFLRRLSYSKNIPLSTLKLNLKILRELNLITSNSSGVDGYGSVELTESGGLLLDIILEKVRE